jgi:argininosuccinate lyase
MRKAAEADYSNATDLADFLASKGLPFRESHEVAARLVAYCTSQSVALEELPLTTFQEYSSLFDPGVYEVLKVENVVMRRTSRGGTSPQAVREQIERAKAVT